MYFFPLKKRKKSNLVNVAVYYFDQTSTGNKIKTVYFKSSISTKKTRKYRLIDRLSMFFIVLRVIVIQIKIDPSGILYHFVVYA